MSGELRDNKSKRTVNPAKRSKAVQSRSPFTFINYTLDKAQTAALKAQDFPDSKYLSVLERFLGDGYKVTQSFDTYHDCFTCSILTNDSDNPNTGRILTGRGNTMVKAFKQACYLHYEVFDGVWPEGAEPQRLIIDD